MSQQGAAQVRVRPRQSLSARLWLLATLAVLLSEIVVFLPYIAHERRIWLSNRIEDASIATLDVHDAAIEPAQAERLLRLLNTTAIVLSSPTGSTITIGNPTATPAVSTDLRREGLLSGIRLALHAMIFNQDRQLRVVAANPFLPGTEEAVVMNERLLTRALREFASDFLLLALLIAGVTGGLVYLAVLVLLVRPMRRITGSIAAFRAEPESTTPLDPDDVTVLPNDEIAVAGRELAAMQHELRAALWRNARLAALGTVFAKVSHDLRGILTPALLTSERLQMNSDPKVQRAGETLAQAVDRATELVRRSLDYAREGPPALQLVPVELAPLIDEAAHTARPMRFALRLDNTIDPTLLVNADRTQLFRVLSNLLRNAVEAGARTLRISAAAESVTLSVEVADDGPGLPEAIQSELFRPFASGGRRGGTGLGLAIARDLMVAQGGSIELVETGSTGTIFRLTLRLAAQATEQRARIAPAAAADV